MVRAGRRDGRLKRGDVAWGPPRVSRRKAVWGWNVLRLGEPALRLSSPTCSGPISCPGLPPTPCTARPVWGYAIATASLVVALTAPVLGAIADAVGPRKPWVLAFSALYVVGAAGRIRTCPETSGAYARYAQGWFAQSNNIHPHTALRLLTLSLPFRPQPGHRSAAYGRNIRVVHYCTGLRPTGMPAQPGRPLRAAPANSVRFAAFLEDMIVRLPGRRAEFADGATHTIRLPRFPRSKLGLVKLTGFTPKFR